MVPRHGRAWRPGSGTLLLARLEQGAGWGGEERDAWARQGLPLGFCELAIGIFDLLWRRLEEETGL